MVYLKIPIGNEATFHISGTDKYIVCIKNSGILVPEYKVSLGTDCHPGSRLTMTIQ